MFTLRQFRDLRRVYTQSFPIVFTLFSTVWICEDYIVFIFYSIIFCMRWITQAVYFVMCKFLGAALKCCNSWSVHTTTFNSQVTLGELLSLADPVGKLTLGTAYTTDIPLANSLRVKKPSYVSLAWILYYYYICSHRF